MPKNNQILSGLNRTVNLLYLFGGFFLVTSVAGLFYANTVKIEKINYLTHILDSVRISPQPAPPVNDSNLMGETLPAHDTIQTISTVTIHDTIQIHDTTRIIDTVPIRVTKLVPVHDTTYKTQYKYLGTKDSLSFVSKLALCAGEKKDLSEKTRVIKNDLTTILKNIISYKESLLNYNPASLRLGTRKDSCCFQLSDIMRNVLNQQMLNEMIRKDKALLDKYK